VSQKKNVRELAEMVGALQDTLRTNSDAIKKMADQQYAVIISLDVVFMELVQLLPESERQDILQNQFDESLSSAENDLVTLKMIHKYFSRRIEDCERFIRKKEGASSP